MIDRIVLPTSKRLGTILDGLVVPGVCIAWWRLWGDDRVSLERIPDVAIPISIAGSVIAARRLFVRAGELSTGLKSWGWHGAASLMAFVVWYRQELQEDSSWDEFALLLMTCAIALSVQGVIGLVAGYRLLRGRAESTRDKIGSVVCVGYLLLMGYWLLFVWE